MIKDTNPDHYKVDGANFIEYMNDPKISGFGNWMFANGFNSGVWASRNWISVKDRLPEPPAQCLVYSGKEHILRRMETATYTEWGWMTPGYFQEITHWMPLPEPPKEVSEDD